MRFTSFKVGLLIAIGLASTVAALEACSGDNSTSDGGQDGTTNDVAQGDTSTSDVVTSDSPVANDGGCPTYNGSVAFCKAAVTRCNTCGTASTTINTCQLENFDAVCNYIANVFSAEYQAATLACAADCDQDAQTACQKAELADASLTTAQTKLVTDYCGRCGASSGCAAQIAQELNVLEYGDNLAASIDSKCTPDAGGADSGACQTYGTCAVDQILGALGGAPCSDAGKD